MSKKFLDNYHDAERVGFNSHQKSNIDLELDSKSQECGLEKSDSDAPLKKLTKTSAERKAEQEYYRLRFWENRVVDRELYEYVKENVRIPDKEGYREFFWYLVLNIHRQHFHDILVGGPLIAAFVNRSIKSKAAKGDAFLERFNREVMVPMGSGLKTKKYNYIQGRCRATKKYHFGRHQKKIENLLLAPLTDLVFIKDGATASKSDLFRIEKESLGVPDFVEKIYPLPDEVIFIQNYLNSLPSNFFTKLVRSKVDDARKLVKFLKLKDQAVKMQYAFLNWIEIFPMPKYQQSRYGKSVRLYSGSSIAALTRELRRFFLSDCPEGDLKCAQLAIGSVLFDYPKIYEFLSDPKNKGDIWSEIIPDWIQTQEFDFVKEHVKEAIYSVQYTMERTAVYFQLVNKLEPEFGYNSNILANQIMQSWVFQEMFQNVNVFVKKLESGIEIEDAFGRLYKLSEKLNAGALMACLAQSYETKILYPAFKYVVERSQKTKRDAVRIVLFQFDGFNIWVRNSGQIEHHKNKISEAVEAGIRDCELKLNKIFPIKFEWKENKEKETKNKIKEIKIPPIGSACSV